MELRFDGETIGKEDIPRLTSQLERVKRLMMDGNWRILPEIASKAYCSEPSASSRLRDLRKFRFGCWRVERRPRGLRSVGLWEYRLLPPENNTNDNRTERES